MFSSLVLLKDFACNTPEKREQLKNRCKAFCKREQEEFERLVDALFSASASEEVKKEMISFGVSARESGVLTRCVANQDG